MVTTIKYCTPCTGHGLYGYQSTMATKVDIEVYILAASVFFEKNYKLITGKGRYRELVDCRYMIIYFLKTYTRYTLAAIGRAMGNRDHTTIIHAIRQAENMCEISYEYRAQYRLLVEYLKKTTW